MPHVSEFMQVALDAARVAERVVMESYGPGVEAHLKPDQTPVTQADRDAEAVIVETISRRFPAHGFLGEEYGRRNSDAEHVWIIDPIDGTKNYVRGIPFFATQIALMRAGELVLGVSNMPVMDELLYAEKGRGAVLNGATVRVSEVDSVADAQVSFGGLDYFLHAGRFNAVRNLVGRAGRIRAFGDAYAYHLLATGRCEAVLEAHIGIWDIAALAVIVQEAGGRCTDLTGQPVGVGTTSMLATNGRVHSEILQAVSA